MKADEFLRIWNSCETTAEVAAKSGKSVNSCHSKATKMRRRGYSLKPMKKGGRKAPRVADDDFAKFWQSSTSLDEVASKFGYTRITAGGRAAILRRRGFKLKRMVNTYVRDGSRNPRWKGGRRVRADGYVLSYAPGHPYAYKNFVLEHRLVMEKHLGRYLEPHEIVHHKNENKSDNRLRNLQLTDHAWHAKHHHKGKKRGPVFKPRVSMPRLALLYSKKGLTIEEIAGVTGISYGSLHRHFAHYGIQKRRADPGWVRRGRKPIEVVA